MTQECLFCRIVARSIPAARVFENQSVLAFLDINPINPGHCLIIPKQHVAHLNLCPADILLELSRQLPVIADAVVTTVKADGYNILLNSGRAAGQIIDHLHFHIIPRHSGDSALTHAPQIKYAPGQIENLSGQIARLL